MTTAQTESLLAEIARIEAALPADHIEAARQEVCWPGVTMARNIEIEAYAAELAMCESEAIAKARMVVFMRRGRAAFDATKGHDYPTVAAHAARLRAEPAQGTGLMTVVMPSWRSKPRAL